MNFRNKYVLAIDQGTTSSRAILFNHQGTIITLAQKPFQQYFPKPGWVEHDPNEIWYTQSSVIKEAMAKADVYKRQHYSLVCVWFLGRDWFQFARLASSCGCRWDQSGRYIHADNGHDCSWYGDKYREI